MLRYKLYLLNHVYLLDEVYMCYINIGGGTHTRRGGGLTIGGAGGLNLKVNGRLRLLVLPLVPGNHSTSIAAHVVLLDFIAELLVSNLAVRLHLLHVRVNVLAFLQLDSLELRYVAEAGSDNPVPEPSDAPPALRHRSCNLFRGRT